jgi:hypothetical protein
LQVEQYADRPARVLFYRADDVQTSLMIVVCAVAEVQPKHIGPRVEQRFDGVAAGARRPQRRDDFGITVAAHLYRLPERSPC